MKQNKPIAKLDVYTESKLLESQELIYQILEHLSAGRMNVDLIKQKLIQASKNLPIKLHRDMHKYN